MVHLAVIILSIMLAACGSNKGDDAVHDHHHGTSDAATLAGSWTSSCTANSTDDRTFQDDGFALTYVSFADADCTQPFLTQEQTGRYTVGDHDAVNDVTALDLTVDAIFITLHNEALVAQYEQQGICGGGWQVGERRQLTTSACSAGSDEPDVVYDVFRIAADSLYFGKKDADHTTRTAEARPTTADTLRPFQRR